MIALLVAAVGCSPPPPWYQSADPRVAMAGVLREVPIGSPAAMAATTLAARGFTCGTSERSDTSIVASFERSVERGESLGDVQALKQRHLECSEFAQPRGLLTNIYVGLSADNRVTGVAVDLMDLNGL